MWKRPHAFALVKTRKGVRSIRNEAAAEIESAEAKGTVDANAGEIVASFDGRFIAYGFGELDMLVPAYAATIHKSQGSEYPAVIIPVLTQHYAMCSGTFSTPASRAASGWSC